MSWDNTGSGAAGWGSGDARVQELNAPAPFGSDAVGETNEFSSAADGFGSGDANGFGGIEHTGGFGGGGGGGGGGGCFNCGEEGHMKAECPNPAVAREFTGVCRLCEQQGHRAGDCPNAPPKLCNNCQEEGHAILECKNPRKIDRSAIPDVPAEQAWDELVAAVADREMDDVKEAADKYIKACPDVTYAQLEQAFRAQGVGIYLIAIEKELAVTYTNMDLQGNLQKKFSITWRFSMKPQRPKEAEGWPESPAENADRLTDAGAPVDCLLPKCSNCDELGHTKKNCTQDVNEITDRAEVKCYNCDGVGHRVRDCPNERPDKFACRNCKQSGHSSKECPEPRSAEGVECKKCNEIGHFSKDCPTAPKIPCFNCGEFGHRKTECINDKQLICRNCDGIGHIGKDCPKPRDYTRVTCQNCGQKGHTKVRCTNPTVKDEGGNDGNGGGYAGGESGNAGGYGGESGNSGYGADNGGAGDDFGAGGVTAGGENSWASGVGGGGGSW